MTRLRPAVVGALALSLVLLASWPAAADHERRAPVPARDLRTQPWRSVVLVVTAGRSICTGFVIGRRKVATAAHCLVRDPANGDYRLRGSVPLGVVLYRAYSTIASPPQTFPSCAVVGAWVHPRFVRGGPRDRRFGSRDHDYAVLTTRAGCIYPRDTILGLLVNEVGGAQLEVDAGIRLAGYPSDPRIPRADGLHLWRSQGHVLSAPFQPARLFVTGYVARGMSGGPVLRRSSDGARCGSRWCAAGVLTECDTNDRGLCRLGDSPRGAVRITPAVREALVSH